MTWRLRDGAVDTVPRSESAPAELAPAGTMVVETGDGVVRLVDEAGLPDVLRAALAAGLAIRRVQPTRSAAADTDLPVAATADADATPRRSGVALRVLYGAAHRARLLASSQWFLAPGLLFLALLAVMYATDAGPVLQAAAVTVIALVPVMAWLGVLAHRVDGRELGRAFAAHVGGRGRAHLATDLSLLPFAAVLTAAALIWPLVSQSEHHPLTLDADIVELHLAAALFGVGLGSLLALIERSGWRLLVAVAVFLGLFVARDTPLTPMLRLSSNATTLHTSIAGPAAWLYVPGVILVAAAAILATRQT